MIPMTNSDDHDGEPLVLDATHDAV
jgi:hypothetical protein